MASRLRGPTALSRAYGSYDASEGVDDVFDALDMRGIIPTDGEIAKYTVPAPSVPAT